MLTMLPGGWPLTPGASLGAAGARSSWTPDVLRLKVPMLVMGGADDQTITPAEVEATARADATEAVIVPGIAHHMMLDRRWEAVADRILAWLAERGI